MISPLRIRFVFIFKKYPTPCRRCFVVLMLLLFSLLSRLCDYFCLIFDSSFSSFFRRRLSSFLWWPGTYCIRFLP